MEIEPDADTRTTLTPEEVALDETLLWLCSIASPIGDEKDLCDRVAERLPRRIAAGTGRLTCALGKS